MSQNVNPFRAPIAIRLAVLATALLTMLVLSLIAAGHGMAAGQTVTMSGSQFTAPAITVSAGDTVTWSNNDSAAHTVTDWGGTFHSGLISPRSQYQRSFALPGTYDYYCTIHAGMSGSVTVVDGAVPSPSPTPSPTPVTPSVGDEAVDIFDNGYNSSAVSVEEGSTVRWNNSGARAHTVTDTGGAFHSGLVFPARSFSRTFLSTGTYDYYCTIHAGMVGTVIVTPSGGGGAPSPSATPGSTATSTPTPTVAPPAGSKSATIFDNGYTPGTLNISTGTTVVWANTGVLPHTVTDEGGSFDSGLLFGGGIYSRTFPSAGTFSYYCLIHPEMTATVVVTGSGSGGGSPTPSTTPGGTATPTPTPTVAPPGGSKSATIFDNGYTPGTLDITTGTTVVWANTGAIPHTVTERSGSFDSGLLFAGGSFSQTFLTAGTFEYYCTLHPAMVATVAVTGDTVSGSGSGDPTPPPRNTPTPTVVPIPDSEIATIFDNGYIPGALDITTGTSVAWTNIGALPHTVTERDGAFDSGLLLTGGTFFQTFLSAGTFNYYCTIHPEMIATVVVTGETVTGSGSPTPTPTITPTPSPTIAPPAGSEAATIFDNGYTPDALDITTGTTVVWTNTGDLPHTVTDVDGSFDSGLLFKGESYSRTFSTAGAVSYYCTIHPEMVATVVVTGSDVDLGSPTPSQSPDGTATPASAAAAAPPSGARTSTIFDNGYSPGTLNITTGTTVAWTNTGALPHTVTDRAGSFDSGLLFAGGTYVRTFGNAGKFEYFCTIHPEMVATVTVTGPDRGSGDVDGLDVSPPDALVRPTSVADVATTVDAEMIDFGYEPATITVSPGDTVRWVNTGQAPHTVTDREGAFDSGFIMSNDAFQWTFDSPGTYEYYCTLHPQMVGTVVVRAESGPDRSVSGSEDADDDPAPATDGGGNATGPDAAASVKLHSTPGGRLGFGLLTLAALGVLAVIAVVVAIATVQGLVETPE